MKKALIIFGAAAIALACGSRAAKSTASALDSLSQTVQEPVMAVEPDDDSPVSFDHTVWDFGDITVDDGPVSCTFTVTNNGSEPVAIYEVVSSCGCTDVRWTREPLQPGQSGTISATFKNEDGPHPFDKTLTVYISGMRRPVILRLRGTVHEKTRSLSELFGAERLGDLGLKTRQYKVGTLRQGRSASESAQVANLGRRPLSVEFTDMPPQLSIHVSPNPVPPGGTATMSYTVASDTTVWGAASYSATPVLNGRKVAGSITFNAHTRADFSSWTQEQRDNGALPMFETSTFNFGIVSQGAEVLADFRYTNTGHSPFHIYKVDCELPSSMEVLEATGAGASEKGSIRLRLDTSLLEKGETVLMVTVTGNSPAQPLS